MPFAELLSEQRLIILDRLGEAIGDVGNTGAKNVTWPVSAAMPAVATFIIAPL